jgi:hypothetical protein
MSGSNPRSRGAEGITDTGTIWKKRYAGGKYTLYAEGTDAECDAVIRALVAASDLKLEFYPDTFRRVLRESGFDDVRIEAILAAVWFDDQTYSGEDWPR